MTEYLHYSVLLKESIDLLNLKPDGIYIDGTFGRGGHTKAILKQLGANGRVIAFDKDLEAIDYAEHNLQDSRLTLVHNSFATLPEFLAAKKIGSVDGILLDLGVSSPQIDSSSRGFSFRLEDNLDMRMNNTQGQSAREWINRVSETDLANVLWQFGEERFSRKIAANIVKARSLGEITKTTQLADIIKQSVPFSEKNQHPATRSFQAIRIYINNELGDLSQLLDSFPACLKACGRLVIISFHSLEDRMVKTKFNQLATKEQLPKWVNKEGENPRYRVIAKKIKAGLNEIEENNRSRSAVLRCLEKI